MTPPLIVRADDMARHHIRNARKALKALHGHFGLVGGKGILSGDYDARMGAAYEALLDGPPSGELPRLMAEACAVLEALALAFDMPNDYSGDAANGEASR